MKLQLLLKLIITCSILSFPLISFGQNWPQMGNQQSGITGRITGIVLDSMSHAPVEFATVVIRLTDSKIDLNGSITGSEGQFKLNEIKLGKYDIYISFIGYKTKRISSIELTPENPDFNCGTVYLPLSEVVLEAVEVTGQAALIENKVDRIVYNAEKDATIVGGDATDVLRKVPMLTVDLEGNVSLRGSSNIKILVNGKPSGMFSSNVADALKMFPADQIKSVEVITTPGAKYDAEGTGGIINIITKNKNVEGYTATVNSAVGTRQNRGSVNLAAGKGRFGLNASGSSFYSWKTESENSFFRRDEIGNQTRILEQDGLTENSRVGFFGQAGAFYDINAYNSINSSFRLRGFSFKNDGFQDAIFNDPINSVFQDYRRTSNARRLRSGFDWTTDYRRTYEQKEKEFSIAIQISGDSDDDSSDLLQQSNDPVLFIEEIDERAKNDGSNLEITFQTDYVLPIGENLKLETGAKSVIRSIDSDYNYDLFDPDRNFYYRDEERSRTFDYHQNVYAGYVSFTLKLAKDYSIVAGSRYEFTSIRGSFLNADSEFDNNYGNFVPSIILSRKLGFNTIKVSYAKRIQRPRLFHINPYVNSNDRRNISYGNPELSPEESHQFDLGYTIFNKGTVVAASLYYRRTDETIQSILSVDEQGVSVTSFSNVGFENAYGVNIFSSATIKNFWTLRTNLDLNSFKAKSEQLGLENTGVQYRVFVNSSFSFKKGLKADLFAFFNSPRRTIQGKNPSFWMYNFGLKKDILDERGSIGLVMIDPFTSHKSFISELEGDNFYQKTDFSLPFRSFGINFSYTLGKLDFNQRQRRTKIQNNDLKQGGDAAQEGGSTVPQQ